MTIVSFALRRPITVLVCTLALLAVALGAVRAIPRDILPQLGIPIIYVAQPYGGMSPAQMEGFLTYYYEYHFLYLTGIDHVESKSIQGNALIKLQFHPGTDMSQAMAETAIYVNRARAFMPPGTLPPFVIRFDAGSVPVGNLVFSSDSLSVNAIQDAALNRVRPLFATLPGVSAPPPFGGSARTIVIKADSNRLRAYQISPEEVVNAVLSGSSISPAGSVYFGDENPIVPTNSLIVDLKDFAGIPLRVRNGSRVYLGDVATVEDAGDITTGIALINGKRTVYIPVTKRANASTLSVVDLVKRNLPRFQAALPPGVDVSYQFDQSRYVTQAIGGLSQEGLFGAALTGCMVLLFLRDWRSALIVLVNIPLALSAAVLGLWLTGQTINLMTLGGLALAVGILVDESTVTVENIHYHLAQGKRLPRAVADSGQEVALPLLVSMLCILSVFTPTFFMTGAARALFAPLSLGVGFAMVASYVLSRTLVPVLCCWFLRDQKHQAGGARRIPGGILITLIWGIGLVLVLAFLAPRLGLEILPVADQGQVQLRLKAPAGTRLEKTEQIVLRTEDLVRSLAGDQNLQLSLAFLGTQPPSFPINTVYLWTSGPEEAMIQLQFKPHTVDLESFKTRLREEFARRFSGVSISFEPGDIIGRVLSLGSPTPIEVAISGPDFAADRLFAERVKAALAGISSLRDLQYGQTLDYPTVEVKVDRIRAGEMGTTAASVAHSVLTATSSSRFVTPSYWADSKSGIAYSVQVQIPNTQMQSVADLRNVPVNIRQGTTPLSNVASVASGVGVGEYDRYNMQRTVTLTANYANSDLGRVAAEVRRKLAALGDRPPRVSVALRGQIPPLDEIMQGLGTGMWVAVLVIVLLLWANFQSFRAALVILAVIPAALAGAVLAMTFTSTTLNLESFMGAIMSMGVGVANAILLVNTAVRLQRKGRSPSAAGTEAAGVRLRPILMTSLAMGAGMVPLALGWSEGGQQSAPLGRAVLGGLAASTLTVLFVLPNIFGMLASRSLASSSLDPDDPSSPVYEP